MDHLFQLTDVNGPRLTGSPGFRTAAEWAQQEMQSWGLHLQGNDMARPIFEAWFALLKDLGVSTVTIRDTGGTDHLSFDAVGLPGFQFIQDPLDYGSRTHHSDLDVYDHVQAGDLMQAAAVVASLAYDAATRSEMIPRKPLPKPLPPKPAQ